MFDSLRTQSADRTTEPDAAHADPATSRVRLAKLAAKVASEDAAEARARSDPGAGPVGRLVERWLPAGMHPPPSARGRRRRILGVLLAVVVASVASVVAVLLLARTPEREQPPALPVAHAVADATTGASLDAERTTEGEPPSRRRADAAPLVVSVVGKVADPGLVRVKPGSRVADAINAAGGAHDDADLLTVNLARRVSDGEQLYVGVAVPPGTQAAAQAAGGKPGADGTAAAGGAGGKVDLNSADQGQLEELSGVGEVTAQQILEWRAEHGRFTAVEQLREVDGIGEKRLEELRDQVSIG